MAVIARLAFGLAVLALSGCVTYHGPELPAAGQPAAAPLARRATKSYAFRVNGRDCSPNSSAPLAAVDKGVAASRVVGEGGPDRNLNVAVVNNERSNPALPVLCGLTLFLFPMWYEDEITVTATLVEDTKAVRVAEARGTVKTICELFLVFALPANNWSATEETVEALTRKACEDLVQERDLPGAGR